MRSRRRIKTLALNTAAALVGAAIAFVIIRTTTLESWILKDPAGPQAIVPVEPKATGRVAMSEPEPKPQIKLRPNDSAWQPSVAPDSTDTGSWSTDIQPAPALTAPQSSSPKPVRPRRKAVKKRKRRGSYTLKSRLAEIAPTAKIRLAAKFRAAKMAWPPAEVAFVAIKDERTLELHARSTGGVWKLIHRYRVLAASGGAGPKLRRGDRQVPEGVYRIVYLNPNSAYHVSLRVNYPGPFDRRMAKKDGRKDLGGDIMIHGKKSSAGCLAMGDPAAEELFVLAAETGRSKIKLIISPTDFRRKGVPAQKPGQPKWLPKLYTKIASSMSPFKAPPRKSPGLLSFFTQ